VDPDQDVVLALRFAHHEGDVGEVVDLVLVGAQAELAERGGQLGLHGAADLRLVGVAVLDDLGHRNELYVVLFRELLQVGHPGHRAVLFHDLADHTGRFHAGEPGQIDGRLCLTSPLQNAARLGPQGEHVTGHDEVFGARGVVHGDAAGVSPVGGGDARRDAVFGLDGGRERGAHA
jgi:hypothetical protein